MDPLQILGPVQALNVYTVCRRCSILRLPVRYQRPHCRVLIQLGSIGTVIFLDQKYLSSDRLFLGQGDNGAHKSHRYRNMRWFCICWTTTYTGFFISGVTVRMLEGAHMWYNFLPL